ncbi:MAG TPA: hypothetical protein VMW10_05985 [Alphaproteobacteria bacterium]|nr:hypothetical protein [Alphaproteobacteria bacterium]
MKRQHPENPDLFWCPKCQDYKLREEFHINRNRKHGIASYCKLCTGIIGTNSYYKHIERQLKYREANKEKHREYCKTKDQLKKARKRANKYHLKHPTYNSEYQKANPQKVKVWDANRNKKPERKQWERERGKKEREILTDRYIKRQLGYDKAFITNPKMIELKRQQITMKRTLKQFKEWRSENEPDRAVIYGE